MHFLAGAPILFPSGEQTHLHRRPALRPPACPAERRPCPSSASRPSVLGHPPLLLHGFSGWNLMHISKHTRSSVLLFPAGLIHAGAACPPRQNLSRTPGPCPPSLPPAGREPMKVATLPPPGPLCHSTFCGPGTLGINVEHMSILLETEHSVLSCRCEMGGASLFSDPSSKSLWEAEDKTGHPCILLPFHAMSSDY